MPTDFAEFFPEPREWASANYPMTDKQSAYLADLFQELGVTPEPRLTKADASRQISICRRLIALPKRDRQRARTQASQTPIWVRILNLTERIEAILDRRAGEPISSALRKARADLYKLRAEAEQPTESAVGLWIGLALTRASSLYQRAWSDLTSKRSD